jgi:5'-3' exonuclease
MILVDLNQVMISNLMMNLKGTSSVDENLVRHMVFNSLRMYKQKFTKKYGDLVICCDDKNYWRKQVFPHYKASRKTDREKSEYNWNEIFTALNNIRDEIRENAPYKVIQVEHAEADDVIGTICHKHGQQLGGDPILILSGDKDFQQLQEYSNVEQFSPIMKKFLKCTDPQGYLVEHILKGDRGDGVPNILSPGDVFVSGGRQKPMSKKKMQEFIANPPVTDARYIENATLVDLKQTPEDMQSVILEQFNSDVQGSKRKLLDLFITKRMNLLIDSLEEF